MPPALFRGKMARLLDFIGACEGLRVPGSAVYDESKSVDLSNEIAWLFQ